MFEEFVKAVFDNNIEAIENIINDKQFNVDWIRDPRINVGTNNIHNVTMIEGSKKPLMFYAMERGLNSIVKTLIELDNPNRYMQMNTDDDKNPQIEISLISYSLNIKFNKNEIVDFLLGREDLEIPAVKSVNDNILRYIEKNKYIDFKDISYTAIQSIIEYASKENLFSTFKSRGGDWNIIVDKDEEQNSLTAIEYFFHNSSISLDKILDIIESLPNTDFYLQKLKCLNKVIVDKDNVYLIKKYLNLFEDYFNKFDDNGLTPITEVIIKSLGVEVLDSLLNINDVDGLPIFNVNINFDGWQRMIDAESHNSEIVKILRYHGSVEPKKPISNSIQKIVINNQQSPDLIAGNKKKTIKIMKLLRKEYPLSKQQIADEITWLINLKDYSTYFAEWQDQDINTVLKVINKLSSMTTVSDRLSVNWSFKKILGTIIHIVKDDQELLSNLETTLSQLQMCSLSKLIHLLNVVQDKLIAKLDATQNDYSKMSIDNFENVLKLIFSAIESLGDNGPLFFAKWLNDRLNEGNNKNPDKWNPATQKIQGIINKTFAENFEGVDGQSFHFNDGLELKLISELKEYLMPNSARAQSINENSIIHKYIKLIEQGSEMLIDEYLTQFINNRNLSEKDLLELVDEIAESRIKILNNTSFYDVTKQSVTKWITEIKSKVGFDVLKTFFIKLREEFEFKHDVKKVISVSIDPFEVNTIKELFLHIVKNSNTYRGKSLIENMSSSPRGVSPEAKELIEKILAFKFRSSDEISFDELSTLGLSAETNTESN